MSKRNLPATRQRSQIYPKNKAPEDRTEHRPMRMYAMIEIHSSLHLLYLLAITSTYLPPFFLPLTVDFLLPALGGPPSRSSKLLAWLSELDGRGGGIRPAAPGPFKAPGGALPTEAGVPAREGGFEGGPLPPSAAGGPDEVGGRLPIAERLPPLATREGGPMEEGGPEAAALATRLGGPLGGGGVEAAGDAASAPPFLLTHLFRSLSK